MIIINSIKDLEKYKRIESQRDVCDYIYYEFKENGEYCDVEFNIEIFFSNDKIYKGIVYGFDELDSLSREEDETDFNLYIIRAKNVIFNKDCYFDILESDNATCKYAYIETMNVSHNIYGEVIESLDISCNELNCNSVKAESITANKIICDDAYVSKLKCENINIKNLLSSN